MKFVISKELEHSGLLNTLMTGVSFTLAIYMLFDVILHGFMFGSDILSIKNTLYGNQEEFVEPMLFDTLLLQVHIDLFMTLISLMILSTIYIRIFADISSSTPLLIHLVFIFGLISPILLLVAYMSSPFFVYLWIGTFLSGHILAIYFAIRIIKKLLKQ